MRKIVSNTMAYYSPATLAEGYHKRHTYGEVPSTKSKRMDHVFSRYPASGFFLIGDFNHFPDGYITSQYNLKQMVKNNTRGEKDLDISYSNASQYKTPQILPYVGHSDHNAVLFSPDSTTCHDRGKQIIVMNRIQGRNEKILFVNALLD